MSLDVGVVRTLRAVEHAKVPEMPDRIIVATAQYIGVELITKDAGIAAAAIMPTVW